MKQLFGSIAASLLSALLLAAAPIAVAQVAVQDSTAQTEVITDALRDLMGDDPEKRIAAVVRIGTSGYPLAGQILEALVDDRLYSDEQAQQIYIVSGQVVTNVIAQSPAAELPGNLETLIVNNALRSAVDQAKAALALSSSDPVVRRKAAISLQASEDEALKPVVDQMIVKEKDERVLSELLIAQAMLTVQFGAPERRADAIKTLAQSDHPIVRQRLSSMLRKDDAGNWTESDAAVRDAAQASLKEIEARLQKFEIIANLFSGISLGSILLLAALGLAITYGLMGVINMAHGEFLMIGAYVTFLTQVFFRTYFPESFSFYVIAAIPLAFLVTGVIGVILERSILRWLYGRPLETLLTTWGVSLLLIQSCRTIFGAQNVEVENPVWLSGGIVLAGDLVIPWNRIMIIGFAMIVLLAVAILLTRTRAGLYVRGVTQNRSMAACTGVATDRVDMLTFGFGSGIAGLGGVALSQIGNVGPDLGQQYIVDSFMVVVLGGVGQLAGTVIAALGLGSVTKLIEPMSGAVLAKISVLVFIILFIQKRPQGLFALKGRSAEA